MRCFLGHRYEVVDIRCFYVIGFRYEVEGIKSNSIFKPSTYNLIPTT